MQQKNKFLGYTSIALTGVATVLKVAAPVMVNAEPSYNAAPFSGLYISVGGIGIQQDLESTQTATNAAPTAVANESSNAVEGNWVGFEESATTLISRSAAKLVESADNDYMGVASIGFNVPLGQSDWLLGAEASMTTEGQKSSLTQAYTLSTLTGGDANGESLTITNTTGQQNITVEDGETWSIALKPSYAINSHVLVYGKMAYHQIQERVLNVDYSSSATFDKQIKYEGVKGYGLGLGTTLRLYSGFFVDISADYIQHENITITQDDSNITATLTSIDLTSATHEMSSEIDTEAWQGAVKIGWRF